MAAFTTIDDAGAYFKTVLYTGNGVAIGSGGNTVAGVGFSGDFTWIKRRTGSTDNHSLFDTPRGATEIIHSNEATIEDTNAETLTSWNADGFVLGSTGEVNGSGQEQVAWNWLAGTTTGIAGSPSITPTSYSFNQDSGFSVIKYAGNSTGGATIPHGLAAAPQCVITKSLGGANDWAVYHFHTDVTAPEDYSLILNSTALRSNDVDMWNDTQPSATLVTLGGGSSTNNTSMIAYCFTPIQGFSKFGTYTGNGNVDGPFVYTGFRPAFLVTKDVSTGLGNWNIFNNKALGYNEENRLLTCNQNAAEIDRNMDLLSNGFKPRDSGQSNESGAPYIYLAVAESPFVNSNGVPNNAR